MSVVRKFYFFRLLPKFLFVLISVLLFVSCNKTSDNRKTLTVYAYDSFCADSSLVEHIVQGFEKETSAKVNLVGCGSATQLYNRLILEGNNIEADVVVGLSDMMDIDESLFFGWQPKCKSDLIDYSSDKLIPFDYGYFSFLKNDEFGFENEPECLQDLTKPEFSKSFVLIDPRTSSVGLGLLKWTILSMGEEKALEWWKSACNNALTVADSWSNAYGIFLAGEVPFVISYSTSPVYHQMNENNHSIRNVPFSDGYIRTTEYLAITEQSENKGLAEQFCEYFLTECQEKTALSITMFPANKKTVLPDVFSDCVVSKEISDGYNFSRKLSYYLDKWSETVVE